MSITIEVKVLQDYLEEMYEKAGLSAEDARICSAYMVQTNLWGIDSHGVLRAPIYIQRIRNKVINPEPDIRVIKGEGTPMMLMDADAAIGYLAGKQAMEQTIEGAKKYGFAVTWVKNSNHFGGAGLYAAMAAQAGMLGISTTNVIPNIGMPGNLRPLTGNNPLALAAPLSEPYDFMLDISMSAVAGGKLLLAAEKNEKIPTTWAMTKEGEPTDDPTLGFAGTLLPMGMHKGMGLSMFIDILTGVLTGGPFLQDLSSMYKSPDDPSQTSHLFAVVNPDFFMGSAVFKDRMKTWVKMIKETPMADGKGVQLIPGELEYQSMVRRQENGIDLPEKLVDELRVIQCELGMALKI